MIKEEFETYLSNLFFETATRIEASENKIYKERRFWKKESPNIWKRVQERTISAGLILASFSDYKKTVDDLQTQILEQYPQYKNATINLNIGGGGLHPIFLLPKIMEELFDRLPSQKTIKMAAEELAEELNDFLVNDTIEFTLYAPLVMFNLPPDQELSTVELSESLLLKKLTEDEIGNCLENGIVVNNNQFSDLPTPYHQYALVANFKFNKKIIHEGDIPPQADLQYLEEMDRAISALRIYKSGFISCNYILQKPKKFIPVFPIILPPKNSRSPAGLTIFSTNEIEGFVSLFKNLSPNMHPTLKLACERLNEAETRISPLDKLLDATIGLEAIPLSPQNENQGELVYRFSLNYASLFPTINKLSEFEKAKNIYSSRSKIVHAKHTVQEKLSEFQKAAIEACEMLRFLIKEFLPNCNNPDYLSPKFWIKKTFGIID
jgi:hypothetical protein